MQPAGDALHLASARAGPAEDELRRGAARLAEAQRIAQLGFWEWEVESGRVHWSDELRRIYGVAPEVAGGTLDGYLRLVHPDDREAVGRVLAEALACGGPFAFEHRIVLPAGEVRTVAARGEVFTHPDGRPARVLGTAQDVSQRRRMEEDLRRSEERFRNLCTQAPVMLLAFDPEGRIREASDHWLEAMGYGRDEVIGRDGLDFVVPEARERMQRTIEEEKRSGGGVRNLPVRALRRDGSAVDLLCTSVPERDDAGRSRGAICVQINLSDLQRAEEALRESEERYRALVEHAPEAIMVLDVDLGRFVDANAHAETLFGVPRERLLTMGPLDFCSQKQKDGRASCEVIEDECKKVLAGENAVFEFTHLTAGGREVHCQTRLSRLPAAGRRLVRATTIDVSAQKQLEEKLRHADRLAAAGALAAGVAHEIGNPLMALSMAALSLERRACDDYAAGKLALIREHCERISRIVRQMSELARPYSQQRVRLDLNRVVRRAVEMVRYDRRAHSCAVDFALAEPLPAVAAAEDELTQVCVNLALNAFDAMAANPETRPRRLTVASAAEGGLVRVAFRDTGHGVPAAAQARLFEPFFTTKEPGRGTGLGLSVSYRILEEHGGSLRLDPGVSDGAAFVFELPAVQP